MHHLQILPGFKYLRFGNFEMPLCLPDFESLVAKLISFAISKSVRDSFVLGLLENDY